MPKLTHLLVITGLLAGSLAYGDTVYTSSFNFETAVSGRTQQIENYATLKAGQLISNGQTVDGITYTHFNLTQGATTGYITGIYNSVSGQSLGVDHTSLSPTYQFFLGGEGAQITLSRPVTAFGMFFNVGLNSGSFGFTTAADSVFTGSTAYDNNTFVFAGLVANTPFQSITISSVGSSAVYDIAELVSTPTPEPASYALLAVGRLVVFAYSRKAYSRNRP